MPHFWIYIPGNPKPPEQIRDETRAAVAEQKGATLLGDEVFFHSEPDRQNHGHATVECTDDQIRKIHDKLNCTHEKVFTSEQLKRAGGSDDDYDGASSASA